MTAQSTQQVPAKPAAKTLIKLGVTKAALAKLVKKYPADKVPDASTKEGYAAIQDMKRETTPIRTKTEKEADIQNAEARAHIKNINAVKNHIIETVKAIEAPWLAEKKRRDDEVARLKLEAEQAEDRRIAEIESKVDDILQLTEGLLGASVKTLEERLAAAKHMTVTQEEYMEFVETASLHLGQAITQLENAVTSAKDLAAQQKEIDAQNAMVATRERVALIKMIPVNSMGLSVADLKLKLEGLNALEIDDSYGDLMPDAIDSRLVAKASLEAMINQQEQLDKKQAELDAQQKVFDDRAAADLQEEANRKAQKDKEEADKRKADEAKAKAADLAARQPEDKKLRLYADELNDVVVPFIDDVVLYSVKEAAVKMVDNAINYIYENTQDSAL